MKGFPEAQKEEHGAPKNEKFVPKHMKNNINGSQKIQNLQATKNEL